MVVRVPHGYGDGDVDEDDDARARSLGVSAAPPVSSRGVSGERWWSVFSFCLCTPYKMCKVLSIRRRWACVRCDGGVCSDGELCVATEARP